ncbi:MAG: WD40/YVTN/BNR-like repeat-containing protein [Minwuia sp.]|uniref:WD40/YVTN/BNR-like repeat-containing protein n=1 Tax=Minwuia sp. TaxID=2493630 RepID=UPI003A843DEE
MTILAGGAAGVFRLNSADPAQVLQTRHVRELVQTDGRIHAGAEDGHYYSDDDGVNWQASDLRGLQVWQIRAAADGALYAGTQPAHLFRSTDGGLHWTEVESFSAAPEAARWGIPLDPPIPGRARAMVIDADDPLHLRIGVEVGGIMTSTDGGRTWTMDLPGDNPDLHMMFAHPADPDVLYASTGYGRPDGIAEMVEGNAGVFRSDDRGRTWTYAWKGITPRYSRPMCIDPRTPYGLTVASAPTAFSSYKDEGGAHAMLYRSEDGGESWRSLCDAAHAPSAANFHGLNVDPEAPGGVIVGTDTGEVWRVSNEAEWTPAASGLPPVWSILAPA